MTWSCPTILWPSKGKIFKQHFQHIDFPDRLILYYLLLVFQHGLRKRTRRGRVLISRLLTTKAGWRTLLRTTTYRRSSLLRTVPPVLFRKQTDFPSMFLPPAKKVKKAVICIEDQAQKRFLATQERYNWVIKCFSSCILLDRFPQYHNLVLPVEIQIKNRRILI